MHRFASPTARTLAAATGLALLAAVPVTAHENHGTTTPKAKKTQNVDLAFAAVAGEQPVACGVPIPGLGTTGRTAQLQDLRFYVSDVKLIAKGGRAVPVTLTPNAFRVNAPGGSVTLIDLENGTGACSDDGTARTNAHVRGTVPKGTYTGVRWTVGVPFALNHTDVPAAPAPLNSAAMAWSWQAGRKFTKIEVTDPAATGRPDGAPWAARTFFVHLGSTGCTGNPATGETVNCKTPNRVQVRLKAFNPATQKIALDLQALLAGNDVTVNRGGAGGCMSGPTDPECAGVFRALGVGWRADGMGNGASPTAKQTVFKAVRR